jgi:hypothetical protein
MWPGYRLAPYQWDMIGSVREAIETDVVACNKSGKDFAASLAALTFFLFPQLYFPTAYVCEVERRKGPNNKFPHTRRVIVTSVRADHLRIFFGQLGEHVTNCAKNLLWDAHANPGGEIVMLHQEVRLAWERNIDRSTRNPMNYLQGLVSEKGEGMSGHHAAYTLLIGDEASGLEDVVKERGAGWAMRFLFFGNAENCQNFWREAVEAGDLLMAV